MQESTRFCVLSGGGIGISALRNVVMSASARPAFCIALGFGREKLSAKSVLVGFLGELETPLNE